MVDPKTSDRSTIIFYQAIYTQVKVKEVSWLDSESQVTFIYSVFNNTNCVKATAQYQNRKIVYH